MAASAVLAGQTPAVTSSDKEPAGVVEALKGRAIWRSSSTAPEEPLEQGWKLYPGEAVRCISECALTLRLYATEVQITEKTGWYPIPKATDDRVPGLGRGGRSAQLQAAPAGSSPQQDDFKAPVQVATTQITAARGDYQTADRLVPAATAAAASLPETALPATGSTLHLVGLAGVLLLAAFVALRLARA